MARPDPTQPVYLDAVDELGALRRDLRSLLAWADNALDVAPNDRQLTVEHMSAEIAALLDGKPTPARPF